MNGEIPDFFNLSILSNLRSRIDTDIYIYIYVYICIYIYIFQKNRLIDFHKNLDNLLS